MRRSVLALLLSLQLAIAYGQENGPPLNVFYGSIPAAERTFFVAPDGDNDGPGTEGDPWATLDHAVGQVQRGDVIVMRGGVYHHDETIRIQSPSGFTDEMIVVTAYPGEVPILDFSSQPKVRDVHGIRLNANWWHIIGITLRYASHNGIRMDGSFNILEQVTAYGHHDTGIHMAGGASNNLIKNCDSFHNFNYDPARTPRIGNNADGFSAKFNIGPGNRYYGNRSWENSDDGYDFWEAQNTIIVENSWAFGNGDASVFDNPDNFEGNGNGFKLGGNFVEAAHVVIRSLAFDNFGVSGNAKGFDYNNNPGAMTLIHNTAYNNGRNFFFPLNAPSGEQAVFLNNLSGVTNLHASTPPSAVLAGNSWQQGTAITEDMFVSVDTELAKSPRNANGSLPATGLLVPVPGSFPIDHGVAIAEPFYGAAPDIGAYEHQEGDLVDPWITREPGQVVSRLHVFDMAHGEDWAVLSDMEVGNPAFGDADDTFATIPGSIHVDEWIQTALESRTKNFLFDTAEFTLSGSAQVFVAHSNEILQKPDWLDEYAETDIELVLESGGVTRGMTLFQRDVEANEAVVLGRNSTDGADDVPMYIVMVGSSDPVAAEFHPESGIDYELKDVYPNPVSSAAVVSFSLRSGADVSVRVYDALGRQRALVAEGHYGPGQHTVAWDAQSLSSGVYYVHLTANGYSAVKSFVRIR